ncbi:MAG: putative maltokinase [PVC group bacterium]
MKRIIMQNTLKTIILPVNTSREALFHKPFREKLEPLLPAYLRQCRWFGGKARTMTAVRITGSCPLTGRSGTTYLCTLTVSYRDGGAERYLLPVSCRPGEEVPLVRSEDNVPVLARVTVGRKKSILFDGAYDRGFREDCFRYIAEADAPRQEPVLLKGTPGRVTREWIREGRRLPEPRLLGKEQSNTSFVYGDAFILKLYRRPAAGIHPEVEMARFLTEETGFTHTAPFAGFLELSSPGSPPATIGLLQAYVHHQDDAWNYSLRQVSRFLQAGSPEEEKRAGESYAAAAGLLGRRTAELHQALISAPANSDFAARAFTPADREELHASIRLLSDRMLEGLRVEGDDLPPEAAAAGRKILRDRSGIFRLLGEKDLTGPAGMKTRVHGDYHLGQLLCTGDDFVIIDFEGEPARPIEERRRKRSPLVDVAGMIRSFHYAAYGAIFLRPGHDPEKTAFLTLRAELWYRTMSDIFLTSYLKTMAGGASVLPGKKAGLKRLLDLCMLEKVIYELNYELNNRPDWAIIPLRGLRSLLSTR